MTFKGREEEGKSPNGRRRRLSPSMALVSQPLTPRPPSDKTNVTYHTIIPHPPKTRSSSPRKRCKPEPFENAVIVMDDSVYIFAHNVSLLPTFNYHQQKEVKPYRHRYASHFFHLQNKDVRLDQDLI